MNLLSREINKSRKTPWPYVLSRNKDLYLAQSIRRLWKTHSSVRSEVVHDYFQCPADGERFCEEASERFSDEHIAEK